MLFVSPVLAALQQPPSSLGQLLFILLWPTCCPVSSHHLGITSLILCGTSQSPFPTCWDQLGMRLIKSALWKTSEVKKFNLPSSLFVQGWDPFYQVLESWSISNHTTCSLNVKTSSTVYNSIQQMFSSNTRSKFQGIMYPPSGEKVKRLRTTKTNIWLSMYK